jgi:hypothetical protein
MVPGTFRLFREHANPISMRVCGLFWLNVPAPPLTHTNNTTNTLTYIHEIERENIIYLCMYVVDLIEEFCSGNTRENARTSRTNQAGGRTITMMEPGRPAESRSDEQ